MDKIFKVHLPKPRFKVISQIATRWSPRYYSQEEISQKNINTMLEAARWAPSGYNKQPWYFYYVQKPKKAYEKLASTLLSSNPTWATTAPLLILGCVDLTDEPKFGIYDLGAAVFSLVIQARNLGYYSRQMGSFDKIKVKKIFKLKKNLEPYIIIAVGKIGDYATTSKEVIEVELEPKSRKTKIAEELNSL